MSLPKSPFAFRIEHPGAPGMAFDLAHTESQAESKLVWLQQTESHEGLVIVPNEASAPVAAPAPEIPLPDTLALWLDELIQSEGSRDAAYKFLFDHLIIAQKLLRATHLATEALRAQNVAQAEPQLPPVCPFKSGNVIADNHSGSHASVQSIDDKAGVMIVLLPDRTTHQVPAINYTDFELAEKTTPDSFFTVPPAAEPVAPPVIEPRKPKSEKKVSKRAATDLLKKN